ncbi:protein FAM162A-like [Rhinophrynus dorsalis]
MWGAVLRRSGLRSLVERAAVLRTGAAPIQRPLGAQDPINRRGLCSKPEDSKPKEPGVSFRVPGHKPTNFERKLLVWGGRFKKEEDIPELVSYEMVDMAKSKVRVKVAFIMVALTIIGCITMVVSGKKAAARHDSLAVRNLERKARLKDEALKEEAVKQE